MNPKKKSKKPKPSSSLTYPTTPMPPSSLVESVYKSNSRSGRVLVQDAIQAVCQSENVHLKKLQAAVQKEGDAKGKDAVCRARVAVKDVENRCVKALEEIREQKEMEEQRGGVENPVNKRNWERVAKIMGEIARMKEEEKSWVGAMSRITREFDGKKAESDEMRIAEDEKLNDSDVVDEASDDVNNRVCAETVAAIKSTIEDVTLSSDRIQHVLRNVGKMVAEGDKVKRELYGRWRRRMFEGYGGEDGRDAIRGMLG